MMKILKRTVPLILALLMILGTVAGALSTLVYAAPALEFDEDKNKDTILISGNFDSSIFPSAGTYTFTITQLSGSSGQLTFKPASGSESTGESFTLSGDSKTLTWKNYSFSKTDDSPFKDKDSFSVVVKQKDVAIGNGDPIITYQKVSRYQRPSKSESYTVDNNRNQSSTSEITRGRDVNIYLDIIDPNLDPSMASSCERPYLIVQSGSFKQVLAGDISSNSTDIATTIDTYGIRSAENGIKLQFDIFRLRYTGSGDTLKFTFGYYLNGEKIEYNASVTIPECEEYVKTPDKDDEDEEDVVLDPLVPNIIVESYSYGSEQVTAGQTFPLTITFTNTSAGYDLQNIIMKVSTGEGLTIASSSNTYYISGLDRKNSITRTIDFRTLANAEPGSHNVDIEFSFQYVANDKRNSSTSKETIAIPVSQVDRFSINPIDVSPYVYVGEEMSLSVNFVNKGRSMVYNVSAELQCEGVSSNGQKTFVGNMESGTENSADFFLTPQEAGTLQGKVVITYEDSNMNIKEVSMPFEAMVQGFDMPEEDPNLFPDTPVIQPEEESNKIDGTKIGLGFAGAVIAGMTAFVTVRKIKTMRSGDEDEVL